MKVDVGIDGLWCVELVEDLLWIASLDYFQLLLICIYLLDEIFDTVSISLQSYSIISLFVESLFYFIELAWACFENLSHALVTISLILFLHEPWYETLSPELLIVENVLFEILDFPFLRIRLHRALLLKKHWEWCHNDVLNDYHVPYCEVAVVD